MLSLLKIDAGEGDREQFQRFAVATAPIVYLVEISGFAMLASELHQGSAPWNSAQETWNQYLTDGEKGAFRISILNDALRTANLPGTIAPGEIVRTGWRTQAQEWVMRSVGLDQASVWPFFADGSEHRSVQHPSALVRAFAREAFPGAYRGIDVFAAAFFTRLPGAESSGRGFRFNGLVDALRRESNRSQSENFEDREDPRMRSQRSTENRITVANFPSDAGSRRPALYSHMFIGISTLAYWGTILRKKARTEK